MAAKANARRTKFDFTEDDIRAMKEDIASEKAEGSATIPADVGIGETQEIPASPDDDIAEEEPEAATSSDTSPAVDETVDTVPETADDADVEELGEVQKEGPAVAAVTDSTEANVQLEDSIFNKPEKPVRQSYTFYLNTLNVEKLIAVGEKHNLKPSETLDIVLDWFFKMEEAK